MKETAWAYFANPNTISEGDWLILQDWGSHGTAWNRASAPIVRDFLDQSVSTENFLKTTDEQLRDCRAVFYKMETDWAMIENAGVKTTLKPLVEIHGEMISHYANLRQAAHQGDVEKQKQIWANLGNMGKQKREIFMPILRRLDTTIPAHVLAAKRKELQDDIANRLSKRR